MKYLLVILSMFVFVSVNAQIRTNITKGLQRYTIASVAQDSGHVTTKSTGEQIYITNDSARQLLGIDTLPNKNYVDSSIATVGASAPISIYPAQITSNQNDYNPTGWATANNVYINSDNQRSITSFAAFADGTVKKIINNGRWTIFIYGEHPSGTAANRVTGLGGDYKLYPGKSMDLIYDGTAARCRILSEENIDGKTGLFYEWNAGSSSAGVYGFFDVVSISSGLIPNGSPSTTTIPAFCSISTAGSSNGGGAFWIAKQVVTFSAFGSAHNYVEAYFSIPTLSDGSNPFTVELQLTNTPSTSSLETNNTIGIRYSHTISGGDWELFSQDNAGAEGTPDDLDVAVAANTLYKLRLESDKSNTEARAYINDDYVGRITTNLPNAVVCGARIVLLKGGSGANARTLNVHNFSAGAIYK